MDIVRRGDTAALKSWLASAPAVHGDWGYLRFGPIRVFLSEAMADARVAVCQLDEEHFAVCYRNYQWTKTKGCRLKSRCLSGEKT